MARRCNYLGVNLCSRREDKTGPLRGVRGSQRKPHGIVHVVRRIVICAAYDTPRRGAASTRRISETIGADPRDPLQAGVMLYLRRCPDARVSDGGGRISLHMRLWLLDKTITSKFLA